MSIVFHEKTGVFHIYNEKISYVMTIMRNHQLGQLYFGKRIHDREDFGYLLETISRAMGSYVYAEEKIFSLEHIKQEYGVYGTTDYRHPAVEVLQKNGSRLSDFQYQSHVITPGKPKLAGLPATYTEDDSEAETLTVFLKDPVTGVALQLLYTIFAGEGVIARSARFENDGEETVHLTRAMSLCMDLPDHDYEWLQFSGAWSRERHLRTRRLEYGIQAIDSMRGHSSHEQNPFVILKRPHADEFQGEAIGFSLVYSGNFLAQAEVDAHDTTRVLLGINPACFDWKLESGESFQTPEAVMAYTDRGLNDLSQTYHRLYRRRLARGYWRDRTRPVLLNNWEATYFDFTEERLLEIAQQAKACGVELFVLDDGWFGKRSSDHAGLGDWVANRDRLPGGIEGISEKIEALGMKFGLWFEPEMVNEDSDLYRAHPDWILRTPDRSSSHGRYQYVLDFSRREVVDCIHGMMAKLLREAKISYIKWDMNRSITECYSAALEPERQGEVFHRYILGVYDLYERLTSEFPHVLFESCASGGARFDAGMLYYAPQAWASDDSDAVERLKIQYGSSFCYPISSIGSHVSAVPNHQVRRHTPLHTRANTAYFGTFGYELDLNRLTEEERNEVRAQICFMKQYRQLLQFGTFYRLSSPFEDNVTAWMVVSDDKKEAVVGWYRVLNQVNVSYSRLRLEGLDPDLCYEVIQTGLPTGVGGSGYIPAAADTEADGAKKSEDPVTSSDADGCGSCVPMRSRCKGSHYGDELMHLGLLTTDETAGEVPAEEQESGDFDSRIYVLRAGQL